MPYVTHFDSIKNSIDLTTVKFKDAFSVLDFFKTHKPDGGFMFNSKVSMDTFLELSPNKLIYMERYKNYHTIVDIEKFNYVYIIEGTHKGVSRYKIGKANDIKDRISRFEVKIPFDIKLICSFRVKDAISFESELHRVFAEKRLSGEWFDLNTKDFKKIFELGINKEVKDYFKSLDRLSAEYKVKLKKERWCSDREYIRYLESVLVFNNVKFDSRD